MGKDELNGNETKCLIESINGLQVGLCGFRSEMKE